MKITAERCEELARNWPTLTPEICKVLRAHAAAIKECEAHLARYAVTTMSPEVILATLTGESQT